MTMNYLDAFIVGSSAQTTVTRTMSVIHSSHEVIMNN